MSEESQENKKSHENSSKNNEQLGFPKEYVEELREREVNAKKKVSEIENAMLKKEEEHKSIVEERIKEVSENYKKELMLTKVQIEALKSGIVDIDGVKLADFSKLSFDEKNNLIGTQDFIEELKKNKSYLFKKLEKTTFEKELPAKGAETKIDVRNMSQEEWQKHKASILKQK